MRQRHTFKERGDDLYQTPPEALTALLAVEELPVGVWEPACGPGAIARALRSRGHVVYATDLVDYASPDQDASGWDFLLQAQMPIGAQAIITNPPYKHAADFARKAIDLSPLVIMLLRLAFLEGVRRSDIIDKHLSRVHVFKNRLPMMHREGWTGKKASSAIPFAWFVWDASHIGPCVVDRIQWEKKCQT